MTPCCDSEHYNYNRMWWHDMFQFNPPWKIVDTFLRYLTTTNTETCFSLFKSLGQKYSGVTKLNVCSISLWNNMGSMKSCSYFSVISSSESMTHLQFQFSGSNIIYKGNDLLFETSTKNDLAVLFCCIFHMLLLCHVGGHMMKVILWYTLLQQYHYHTWNAICDCFFHHLL